MKTIFVLCSCLVACAGSKLPGTGEVAYASAPTAREAQSKGTAATPPESNLRTAAMACGISEFEPCGGCSTSCRAGERAICTRGDTCQEPTCAATCRSKATCLCSGGPTYELTLDELGHAQNGSGDAPPRALVLTEDRPNVVGTLGLSCEPLDADANQLRCIVSSASTTQQTHEEVLAREAAYPDRAAQLVLNDCAATLEDFAEQRAAGTLSAPEARYSALIEKPCRAHDVKALAAAVKTYIREVSGHICYVEVEAPQTVVLKRLAPGRWQHIERDGTLSSLWRDGKNWRYRVERAKGDPKFIDWSESPKLKPTIECKFVRL